MSGAVELIVTGYVKVGDQRALSELLAHRRKMLAQLQAVSGIDPARSIEQVKEEIVIIEAGIEKLKPPAGVRTEADGTTAIVDEKDQSLGPIEN